MPFIVPALAAIGGALGASGTSAAVLGGTVLGGTGASLAGSVLGSGDKTVTTKTILPPELQTAENTDLDTLTKILQSPDSGLGPIKAASQDQINKNYSLLPQVATTKLAARGFGSSGAVGNGVYDTEGARLSDLSGLEGQIAQLSSNRQLTASQIMQQIIAAGRGQSTTYPGNMASAGLNSLGSSLGSLGALLTLRQMLNGGGVPNVFGGGSVNPNTPVSIADVIGQAGLKNPSGEGWGIQ